ncbi:MAG TPA: COX15/CtaA family protein [Chloroflexota bacterium]|jgi:heme A synthase
MRRYYPAFALAAAVGTYLLIVMGGVVRVTDSGLGCPDWPTCHGQLLPPLEVTAIIEYTHRLLGALVSPLILATTLGAWVLRRRDRSLLIAATLAPVLLAVQIVLGAVVVRLELPAMVVLVHLTFALVILALLVWTAVMALPPPVARRAPGPGWRRGPFVALVHATTLLLFILLVVGAYVRASGAGYACVGFPGCNGEALPFGSSPLVDVHLLHRLLAYAVATLVTIIVVQAWRRWRWLPAVPWTATALAVCVVVQITIGAIAVSTGLPALVRGLHLAGAAAVWASATVLVCLLTRARALAPLAAGTPDHGARRNGHAPTGALRSAEGMLRAERGG